MVNETRCTMPGIRHMSSCKDDIVLLVHNALSDMLSTRRLGEIPRTRHHLPHMRRIEQSTWYSVVIYLATKGSDQTPQRPAVASRRAFLGCLCHMHIHPLAMQQRLWFHSTVASSSCKGCFCKASLPEACQCFASFAEDILLLYTGWEQDCSALDRS